MPAYFTYYTAILHNSGSNDKIRQKTDYLAKIQIKQITHILTKIATIKL